MRFHAAFKNVTYCYYNVFLKCRSIKLEIGRSQEKLQLIADHFTNTSTQGVSKTFCRVKQKIKLDIALKEKTDHLIKCLSDVGT